MPQITIVILQYRPDAAALRHTLASLAMQDTRDFAVVLGDDGSAQDYFAESRAYLAAHGITDVQTTKLQPNGGTVKNARCRDPMGAHALTGGFPLRQRNAALVAGALAGRRAARGLRQAGLLHP